MRPTWTSPGRVDGPAWPCTWRGLPGRRVTATPVRSYRTISPLPVRDSRVVAPSAVYFCGTVPRVSPGGRYPPPCPLVSGLSSRGFLCPRSRSARSASVARRSGLEAMHRITWPSMPVAVVTGAGGGLGRAIAVELSRRGFLVHVSDIDPDAAARTAGEIGTGARSAALDVRDEAACRALASEAAARGGTLDLWVNNAGVLATGLSWEQDEATRRAMLEINALGTMNGTVAALEPMITAGRGHVINVISLAGIVAAPGEVSYSASKHAAIAFTLGTLFDLRRAGIGGVSLSAGFPGGISWPLLGGKVHQPHAAGSFSGHLLTPEQVAREVGKLTERPRPILILPRWRGLQLRLLDLFPRLALRLLPWVMRDARRKQRRYKKLIESGKWPK